MDTLSHTYGAFDDQEGQIKKVKIISLSVESLFGLKNQLILVTSPFTGASLIAKLNVDP